MYAQEETQEGKCAFVSCSALTFSCPTIVESILFFIVLERHNAGHAVVWGLNIQHLLHHFFQFYIQNNSFLITDTFFFALASLFFPPWKTRNTFFFTIHLEPHWWWCWTGHLGLTPAKQSQLLVTVWEPFISLFVIGSLSVVVAILWLFTRPNMAPRSLNMEQINFFSSGHLCGGKTVIQLKVINLQSCVVNGRGLGLTDRTEER